LKNYVDTVLGERDVKWGKLKAFTALQLEQKPKFAPYQKWLRNEFYTQTDWGELVGDFEICMHLTNYKYLQMQTSFRMAISKVQMWLTFQLRITFYELLECN